VAACVPGRLLGPKLAFFIAGLEHQTGAITTTIQRPFKNAPMFPQSPLRNSIKNNYALSLIAASLGILADLHGTANIY